MRILEYLRNGPRSIILRRTETALAWAGLAISAALVVLLLLYAASAFSVNFALSLGQFRYDYIDTRPLLDYIIVVVIYLSVVGALFAKSRLICVIAGAILLAPFTLIALPLVLISGVPF